MNDASLNPVRAAPPTNGDTHRAEAQRFLRFLVTGGIAAVCNVASRALLSRILGYGAAVAIAYAIGVLVAFILAKLFVFSSNTRRWHAELSRFAVVNCISFAQVWLVSVGLERSVLPRIGWTWYPKLCAHLAGVASPVITSYFLHKHFTFDSADTPSAAGPTTI